jgi:hypothetical protein
LSQFVVPAELCVHLASMYLSSAVLGPSYVSKSRGTTCTRQSPSVFSTFLNMVSQRSHCLCCIENPQGVSASLALSVSERLTRKSAPRLQRGAARQRVVAAFCTTLPRTAPRGPGWSMLGARLQAQRAVEGVVGDRRGSRRLGPAHRLEDRPKLRAHARNERARPRPRSTLGARNEKTTNARFFSRRGANRQRQL